VFSGSGLQLVQGTPCRMGRAGCSEYLLKGQPDTGTGSAGHRRTAGRCLVSCRGRPAHDCA